MNCRCNTRNRIRWSVYGDDFGHYVIGDDYPSNWLSLGLEEEPWQSPEERKQTLLLELNISELLAWEEFQKAQADTLPMVPPVVIKFVDADGNSDDGQDLIIGPTDEETYHRAWLNAELLNDQLMANLTEAHSTELESILHDENDREGREGPRFDKRLIQRYIVWRVFDLGWTIERFGYFDRFDIGYSGRDAEKPERMGKNINGLLITRSWLISPTISSIGIVGPLHETTITKVLGSRRSVILTLPLC